MSLRTPISKVLHLGSSRSGTKHFIHQRITAVFMIPLLVWLVCSVISLVRSSESQIAWLLTSPISVIGAVTFIIVSLYHGTLGIKMVLEDYIHCKSLLHISLIVVYGIALLTVVAGIISVITINLGIRVG